MSESNDGLTLRFGTRKSKLALWQTHAVKEAIEAQHPSVNCEVVEFSTRGDKILDQPLPEIGGKGLFTQELDEAILSGEIDLAVHSLKDLPTDPTEGLSTVPLLEREIANDVFISRDKTPFSEMPAGARIGTSSPRRRSQLLLLRPDIEVVDIRGNVPTRIDKVDQQMVDGVVLAAAGVLRVGMEDRIASTFSFEEMIPAPGQGMIAATLRSDNKALREILEALRSEDEACEVALERELLAAIGGGCSLPFASRAESKEKNCRLVGRIVSPNGHQALTVERYSLGPDGLVQEVSEALKAHQGLDLLFREDAESVCRMPLARKNILVTRGGRQSGKFCRMLAERGANPIPIPLIRFTNLMDASRADSLVAELEKSDWLAFTSLNGARFILEKCGSEVIPRSVNVACVGGKTAEFLTRSGVEADFVPSQFNGTTLGLELPAEPGQRVLIPGPVEFEDKLPNALVSRNIDAVPFTVYRTEQVTIREEALAIVKENVDVITFASPSAVNSFVAQFEDAKEISNRCVMACIGPTTQERAHELGLTIQVLPEQYTLESLISGLEEFFADETQH